MLHSKKKSYHSNTSAINTPAGSSVPMGGFMSGGGHSVGSKKRNSQITNQTANNPVNLFDNQYGKN